MKPSPFIDLSADRNKRWELLRTEIERWFDSLAQTDGYVAVDFGSISETLGLTVPQALLEWYAISGRREDIWSVQDELLPPDRLTVVDDYLVFCVENQAVVSWGIPVDRMADLDPPVYVQSVDEPSSWLLEEDTLSLFALRWFVYCLKWSARHYWMCGYFPSHAIQEMASRFPRLPFRETPWPGSRFYGYKDAIMEFDGSDHGYLTCLDQSDYETIRTQCIELGFEENANWAT